MLRQCTLLLRQAGFYIALHPWLRVAGFVKVGFSSSLETRLDMPTFKSCFTDEWHYHCVFECESSKEALLLEQAVLYCLSEKRVPHRELLKISEDEVVRTARYLAKKLNLAVVEKPLPSYSISEAVPRRAVAHSSLDAALNGSHSPAEEDACEGEHANAAQAEAAVNEDHADGEWDASLLEKTIAPYTDILKSAKSDLNRTHHPTIDDDMFYNAAGSCPPTTDGLGTRGDRNDLAPSIVTRESGDPATLSRHTTAGTDLVCRGTGFETDTLTPGPGYIDAENYTLKSLRPYQHEAVARVKSELEKTGRTICQMACRCGKTPVAFCVMHDVVHPPNPRKSATGRVLYLVPGLALLRQTARKLFNYGFDRAPMFLIGSDANPVFLGTDPATGDAVSKTMTTDPESIQTFLLQNTHCVLICTYHSSPLLQQLASMIALTVFDECHRVCGSSEPTAFNTMLLLPPHPASWRLFLTATPTYDTPLRMNDERLFGGVAYRYYLREGIDSGFVNSFRVRIVLGPTLDNMVPFILEAMRLVDKMLIFCRDIKHAETLYQQLASSAVVARGHRGSPGDGEGGGVEGPYDDVQPFAAFIAHSQLGAGQITAALAEFSNNPRCVLFNVRLFQEGVEIPDLNAVFFAAPRYSSRDIIQSICRPLNRLPNKPPSYVFLPAEMNPRYRAGHPINLQKFSTLVPFTDALMDEDPTLFEYMLDPQKKSYDFDVVGLRSLRLSSEKVEKFVLPAIRRGVRYSCTTQSDRLHRAARLPWKTVFAEMRRIVLECNRYPKTNDAWVVGDTSVSMNLFYRYCRKGYVLYEAGSQTYLQTYQIRDLESLPGWRRYGVEGPYPWKECMATLEAHLATHRSPPPLDVHKGGFVGLDATPFERLSGCLMHVNQCDGKQEMRLAADKQRDMDELCERYGLKWRKTRNADGTLRKHERSFITDSYDQFKRLLAKVDETPLFREYVNKHYPGYPEKHARMENLGILMDGKVPPRHEPARRLGRRVTPKGKRGKQSDQEPTATAKDTQDQAGKLKKGRPKSKTTPSAPLGRSVMCRVCRVKVQTSEWSGHLRSSEHLAALSGGAHAHEQPSAEFTV